MESALIRRGFADLPTRQVHYRAAGTGEPSLVMLHGAPGSSRQLVPLLEQLGRTTTVLAPDMPGYGDTPLPDAMAVPPPDIATYAAATLELLDCLGLHQVDLYGTHTGGAIAIEIAAHAPARVRRLIVDGLGLFSPQEQAAHLANYAHPITPDHSGAYLTQAFAMLRDVFLFWPWYEHDAAHRREAGLPPPPVVHALLVEMLKSLDTYHLGYRASFSYPTADRLKCVLQKTLLMAQAGDPLIPHTREAAALLPQARFETIGRPDAAKLIVSFLAEAL